jgi:hypothetical protein
LDFSWPARAWIEKALAEVEAKKSKYLAGFIRPPPKRKF